MLLLYSLLRQAIAILQSIMVIPLHFALTIPLLIVIQALLLSQTYNFYI